MWSEHATCPALRLGGTAGRAQGSRPAGGRCGRSRPLLARCPRPTGPLQEVGVGALAIQEAYVRGRSLPSLAFGPAPCCLEAPRMAQGWHSGLRQPGGPARSGAPLPSLLSPSAFFTDTLSDRSSCSCHVRSGGFSTSVHGPKSGMRPTSPFLGLNTARKPHDR